MRFKDNAYRIFSMDVPGLPIQGLSGIFSPAATNIPFEAADDVREQFLRLASAAQSHPIDFHADEFCLNVAHNFFGWILKPKGNQATLFARDHGRNFEDLTLMINSEAACGAFALGKISLAEQVRKSPRLTEIHDLREHRTDPF